MQSIHKGITTRAHLHLRCVNLNTMINSNRRMFRWRRLKLKLLPPPMPVLAQNLHQHDQSKQVYLSTTINAMADQFIQKLAVHTYWSNKNIVNGQHQTGKSKNTEKVVIRYQTGTRINQNKRAHIEYMNEPHKRRHTTKVRHIEDLDLIYQQQKVQKTVAATPEYSCVDRSKKERNTIDINKISRQVMREIKKNQRVELERRGML